jgi:hypothetical protein
MHTHTEEQRATAEVITHEVNALVARLARNPAICAVDPKAVFLTIGAGLFERATHVGATGDDMLQAIEAVLFVAVPSPSNRQN